MEATLTDPTHFPEGEKPFLLSGPAGWIETLGLQTKQSPQGVGIICHPHPQHEGTMHNKVVYTLSRAFTNKGLHAVRFNFRGVGKSEGHFDHSVGEVDDLKAVIDWVKTVLPGLPIYLSGFSFGAYIAARGASLETCRQLFSIAPAVPNQPYEDLPAIPCPWVVVQGEEDEVISPQKVFAWYESTRQKTTVPMTLFKLPETSHFFHGKLVMLREIIEDNLLL